MKMLLDEYKMPFFTHNSETKREVEECIARHGLTPTQLSRRTASLSTAAAGSTACGSMRPTWTFLPAAGCTP